MTFALHNITITNFRSYKGTHKFKFPTKEGIYYLTGENLVEDIGANGAGKTTFMDAIVWCLYGATSRGLKATDVLPDWETPGCKVKLELTVGDRRAIVTRTQKPNNLTLDDKIVDQVELERYLRLNQTAFLNSVLNAQFGKSFFSLGASEKLSLFSDINGLEKWLEYSKEASGKVTALTNEMDEVSSSILKFNENIKTLKADITNLETEAKEFEKGRKRRYEALEIEFADNYIKTKKLSEKSEECVIQLQIIEKKRLDKKLAYDDLVKRRDESLNFISKFAADKRIYSEKATEIESALNKFRNLRGTALCPHCNTKLDDAHVAAHIQNLLTDKNKNQFVLNRAIKSHKNWTQALFEAKVKVDSAQFAITQLDEDFVAAEKRYDKLEEEYRRTANRNKEITTLLNEIEHEKNPYEKLLGQKRQGLKDVTVLLEMSEVKLATKEAAHAANVFWVKGFKRVRLYIIEQVFQALEVEVNNCLTQLGMQDWQITFDIEHENKTGGVTKGFMVFVKSPRNKAPVKWENWSGGETQRLQLAGDLALANLIMHQAGLKNTIEFFDEPSTHLSTQGMLDFANLLHERALSDGKCIWIIDHAAISNFGEFEAVITVRKDSNGSQITTTA